MSIRKNIRDAVKAAISYPVTDSVYPKNPSEFVAVAIVSDVRDEEGQAVGTDARELSIEIECVKKSNSSTNSIHDELDTMASAVITQVLSDSAVKLLCDHIQYDSLDQEFSGDIDQAASLARITLTAYYQTSFTDPNTRL